MSDEKRAPTDEVELGLWARENLGTGTVLLPLAGDASTRAYLRAEVPRGGTKVLMVTGHPFPADGLPWLASNALMIDLGLPVPQVLMEDAAAGIVVIEDLGDELLQDIVRRGEQIGAAAVAEYYHQALGMLRILRRAGTPRARDLPTRGTELDEPLFLRELQFFAEHFLEGHLGFRPGEVAREALDRGLRNLAARAAEGPRVLCHRDFHARNLVLKDGRLRLIDHQDARLGPDLYDLASLLRDPYAAISGDLDVQILATFLGDPYFSVSGEDHAMRFETVALQRDLKALGTYGYQAVVRGKSDYLEYVPRASALARHALERLPGCTELFAVLSDAGMWSSR